MHLLSVILVVLASGAGIAIGSAVAFLPLLVQFFVGAVSGLLVLWSVPTVWAIVVAAHAPVAQRNIARHDLKAAKHQHRMREAALRLRLSLAQLSGTQDRIDQYRKLEEEQDERTRQRMMSECDPLIQIMEWATSVQAILAETDIADQASDEFSVNWEQLKSADEIEQAYKRLRAFAEN